MKSNVAKAKSRMDEAESTGSKNDLGYLNAVNDYNRYKKKLGDLEGLQKILEKNDSDVASNPSKTRQSLIYLDTKSSSRVQAGVALGDVDRAKSVQMVVPGMNNTVGDNMDGLINDAQKVRNTTFEESRNHSSSAGIHDKGDIATVAWTGRRRMRKLPPRIWPKRPRRRWTDSWKGCRPLGRRWECPKRR